MHIRKHWSHSIFDIINFLVLALIAVMTLYPFWYIFIASISNPAEVVKGVTLFPKGFTLESYKAIFKTRGIWNATFISVSRTVLGTVSSVFFSAMFAYGITKELLPFRKIIYRLLILSMYISPGFIPYYLVIRDLGLRNNFLVYILPSLIVAFNVVLVKTFIEQLPNALEESAMIDGAGYFRIFIRIVLPLCIPVLASVTIFTAVGHWSSFMDNMFFAPSAKLETLQYLLYKYLRGNEANLETIQMRMQAGVSTRFFITPQALRMTITMIVTFPIILVYPLLQKYFMKGILLGAIKG